MKDRGEYYVIKFVSTSQILIALRVNALKPTGQPEEIN